jgi:glycosyltransferase involved in cell wall biosynthesis
VPFICWAAPRYEGYEKDRSMKQTWNNPLPLFGKWEHRLFSFLARKWGADSSENLLHMCDAIAMLHPQGYEALKQKPEFADKVFWAEKGVDLARADATAPRQEQVDVLFLGGIFHRKGIFDVVEAFARVNKVMPQASLGIAGSGPPELENEMRRMIAELGVNACHFGSVSFHDRWAYLKSARVFAFPSRRDQYNSSLLEAMACGLPAITTTAVDSPIRDGVNGFAIPPGDVPALADRMLRLLRDDAECTRMGRLARESVHDWRDVARQALDEIFVPLTGKDR